jgi:hypothetical protein
LVKTPPILTTQKKSGNGVDSERGRNGPGEEAERNFRPFQE